MSHRQTEWRNIVPFL